MSETPEERRQVLIDEQAGREIENFLSNSTELEYIVDMCESDIARLLVIHWNNPGAIGHFIKQQVEESMKEEAWQRARDHYDD